MNNCKQIRLITNGRHTWIEYERKTSTYKIGVFGLGDGIAMMNALVGAVDKWIETDAPAAEVGKQDSSTTPQNDPRFKKCPLCRADYSAPPALSRTDNKTPICPRCGLRQALEAYENAK